MTYFVNELDNIVTEAIDGLVASSGGADTIAAGRASYVNAEQLKGNIDPGAEAVARLFEHLAG